jgi:hypothetical protein
MIKPIRASHLCCLDPNLSFSFISSFFFLILCCPKLGYDNVKEEGMTISPTPTMPKKSAQQSQLRGQNQA